MNNLLFVTEAHFNERVNFFKGLSIQENELEEKNGDKLFGGFQVGNTIERILQPYERFHDYEKLLLELKFIDEIKYNNLHKGTPFYFLAWLAFDLNSYNKGLYYIDAAVSEDIVHRQNNWQYGNAVQFYYLENNNYLSTRTVTKIKELIEKQIHRFFSVTGINIKTSDFIDKLVKPIINDNNKTKRSLVSAIYVFLLEFEDLYQLLKIRTAYGGSILPFVDHLFNGGLIFESLLKEFYPGNGDKPDKILSKSNLFKGEFPSAQIKGNATSLKGILDIALDDSYYSAFSVTSKLRNTTGHKITWDDIFSIPGNYKILFEQEVNALLYLISKRI